MSASGCLFGVRKAPAVVRERQAVPGGGCRNGRVDEAERRRAFKP